LAQHSISNSIGQSSSDTSIFSALLEGYAPAVVWHMAKILECGGRPSRL